jgi:deoxycytidylate deaminase
VSLAHDALAVGMTGAFGSGCSTAGFDLKTKRQFHVVRLSDVVRQELARTEPAAVAEPSRQKLQAVGDRMRERLGKDVLVRRALQALDDATKTYTRLAFDGIRNPAEAAALQERFGSRFSLLGVLSEAQTRWERVYRTYEDAGLRQSDFLEDDERDRGEAAEYGQQVAMCVDMADAIIVNGAATSRPQYQEKIIDMVDLLSKQRLREPTVDEIHMQVAITSSHESRCLKRHVGAVLIDSFGERRATGFNENPKATKPCRDEERYSFRCYRDIVRNNRFADLVRKEVPCPKCRRPLEVEEGPPWRCSICLRDGVTTDLEAIFFPDRAMSWCTAIHAEDRALRLAGTQARGATLYTTTFPCFQCADHIIMAGVREVVFVEAYPDPFSAQRLDLAGGDCPPVRRRTRPGVWQGLYEPSSFLAALAAAQPRDDGLSESCPSSSVSAPSFVEDQSLNATPGSLAAARRGPTLM